MDITLAGTLVDRPLTPDQMSRLSIELSADGSEVGVGTLAIDDPSGADEIAGGRQAMIEEGTTLISDGFIGGQDKGRSSNAHDAPRRMDVYAIQDANALFYGRRFVNRSRPSETDQARVLAFAGQDLPAADTSMVLGTNLRTLPAKKYTGSDWTELMSDVFEAAGKIIFLHDLADGSGRCLHSHKETEGHACGLAITDVLADLDATTFAPWNPNRNRAAGQLINNTYGRDGANRSSTDSDATSITAHDADGLKHQAVVEFEATSQAELDAKTSAYVDENKDEVDIYECDIGPLDETALALIRQGDRIEVTSQAMGLAASTIRIAHMTLTLMPDKNGTPLPGLFMAHLELNEAIRLRPRVSSGSKHVTVNDLARSTQPPWSPAGVSKLVAVGTNAQASTSPDGATWTLQTSGSIVFLTVAWSPFLQVFVAGTGLGGISTSDDGAIWIPRTSPFGGSVEDICWSPDRALFVAVGQSGALATSANGIDWTSRTSTFSAGGADIIYGVCWSAELGRFVAVGEHSGVAAEIATSPDGINWTQRTSPFSTDGALDVAWSAELSLFLAVAKSGKVATSSDGINWNAEQTPNIALNEYPAVAWSPTLGLFAIGGGLGVLYTTNDGTTWTTRTSGFGTSEIEGLMWSPDLSLFIASGANGKISTSPDGATWTLRTSGFGTGAGIAVYEVAQGLGVSPSLNQVVREVIGIGDGARTIFSTSQPYQPTSLQIEMSGGMAEHDFTQTSPVGIAFGSPPFDGEIVRAEYQRA